MSYRRNVRIKRAILIESVPGANSVPTAVSVRSPLNVLPTKIVSMTASAKVESAANRAAKMQPARALRCVIQDGVSLDQSVPPTMNVPMVNDASKGPAQPNAIATDHAVMVWCVRRMGSARQSLNAPLMTTVLWAGVRVVNA